MQRKYRLEPLWFCGILIFIFTFTALCQEIKELDKVANAILYLANKQTPGGRNPAKTNYTYRYELAEQFLEGARHFDLPWELGVTIGYNESVYRLDENGTRGEIGIMQVGPLGKRYCKDYCGKMETPKEQIYCGYCWFKYGHDFCKDENLEKGLTAYASGDCVSSHPRVIRAVKKRQRHINEIKEL